MASPGACPPSTHKCLTKDGVLKPYFDDKGRPFVECPHCKRMVEMFHHPDHGNVMMGHRTEMPHTPETPWCQGGGRNHTQACIDLMEIPS